jgi:hypothetical protein
VTPLLTLYRLSRYRPERDAQPARARRPGPTNHEAAAEAATDGLDQPMLAARSSGVDDGRAATHDRDASGHVEANLPDVAWISRRDGTRAPGDLEDQAARYDPSRHELTINVDFRAITDMTAYWRQRYEGVPGSRAVIEAQVCEWCEQLLVEVATR